MEMCEHAGCISSRALLLDDAVQLEQWPALLESCGAMRDAAVAACFAPTVVVFDIGGALSKASFVSFLDCKQQRGVSASWQAYTNVSFPELKFSSEKERSIISNNFIICPERDGACQGAQHLRMRLADALWTTISMASRM
jgi:hypothetical protein